MPTIVLISREFSWWRNALGIAASVVILPIGLIVALIAVPFHRPANRSAADVAKYLRDFLQNTGDEWDWDDFACVPIANPELESIRQKAVAVRLPLEPAGRVELEGLLARAELLR